MTGPVPLKLVDSLVHLWCQDRLQGGEFEWSLDAAGMKVGLRIACPGCKSVCATPFQGPVAWQWDGNEEKPTITPSINHVGCWHGWLKEGVLQPC